MVLERVVVEKFEALRRINDSAPPTIRGNPVNALYNLKRKLAPYTIVESKGHEKRKEGRDLNHISTYDVRIPSLNWARVFAQESHLLLRRGMWGSQSANVSFTYSGGNPAAVEDVRNMILASGFEFVSKEEKKEYSDDS